MYNIQESNLINRLNIRIRKPANIMNNVCMFNMNYIPVEQKLHICKKL